MECKKPVIYYNKREKRKVYKYLVEFNFIAEDFNIINNEYDIWNNSIIGLDKAQGKLFFYNKRFEKKEPFIIDLASVKSCSSHIGSKKEHGCRDIVNGLFLVIQHQNKSIPATAINFYYSSEALKSTLEFRLVQKWERLINTYIINTAR